jgi:hypothetical protein
MFEVARLSIRQDEEPTCLLAGLSFFQRGRKSRISHIERTKHHFFKKYCIDDTLEKPTNVSDKEIENVCVKEKAQYELAQGLKLRTAD